MTDAALARRVLPLIDLTNLEDDCTEADVRALTAKAETPHGNVAALCVWPRFADLASDLLSGSGIGVACVVNFPSGDEPLDEVVALTRRTVALGASEIDTVIPYRALQGGNEAPVAQHVEALAEACGDARLKVILETGELEDEALVRCASRLAIDAGADFIKTSTGKVATNATSEAARWMLEELRDSRRTDVGFKPAGGIRTIDDAGIYLALADRIMGADWAQKSTFRFGASSLLGNVLEALGDADSDNGTGY